MGFTIRLFTFPSEIVELASWTRTDLSNIPFFCIVSVSSLSIFFYNVFFNTLSYALKFSGIKRFETFAFQYSFVVSGLYLSLKYLFLITIYAFAFSKALWIQTFFHLRDSGDSSDSSVELTSFFNLFFDCVFVRPLALFFSSLCWFSSWVHALFTILVLLPFRCFNSCRCVRIPCYFSVFLNTHVLFTRYNAYSIHYTNDSHLRTTRKN